MIRILTNKGQEIDYYNVSDLNIRLNRIVDEYNDLETRFSEFSYMFNLPMTANNNRIFGNVHAKNVVEKFRRNVIEVFVYLNEALLFTGVLELMSIDEDNYRCALLSKVSLLVDALQEKDLKELNLPDIEFDYENTIRAHVEANYLSSDETFYQFPLVFYSTFFAPPSVLDGQTDTWNYLFQDIRPMQNYSYILNKTSGDDNEVFFHQLPMAIYLKSIIEQILEDAGWTLGGSFFDKEDIKRIIIPYVGDNDIYDDSTYCSDGSDLNIAGQCDTGTLMLRTANFLPEMGQQEFLQAVINAFNLYFDINVEQKIIRFETYNDLFLNKTNPYIVDGKILADTVEELKVENQDPSIKFIPHDYNKVLGFDEVMRTANTNALLQSYKKLNETPNIYDYLGDEAEPIEIEFGQPVYAKKYLRNTENFAGNVSGGNDAVIFIPQLTRQTYRDNNNMPFFMKDTDTVVNNEEDRIRHDGLPTMFFYLGISDSDFVQQTGKGASSDWFYINFHSQKMKIPFASPYAYVNNRTRINQILNDGEEDFERAYASNLQATYLMMGDAYPIQHGFSLVLSEQGNIYPSMYNKFHEEKFRRYQEYYILRADIRLNIQDWNQLKMHVPVMYENQIYSLIAIENYDVVNEIGNIRLLRQ